MYVRRIKSQVLLYISIVALRTACSSKRNKKQKNMSHSGGAMKLMMVMMVMMAMALLTTSHDIGIHINTSVVTGGYSASRCNGLTDMACRIAHSELDFDLEFMLDSEFSIRLLRTIPKSVVEQTLVASKAVHRCGQQDGEKCHDKGNNKHIDEYCNKNRTIRGCYKTPRKPF